MTKSFLLSKTIWVGVIYFLIGGFVALESHYPTVGWLMMAKAILDIGLRFVTDKPISLSDKTSSRQ